MSEGGITLGEAVRQAKSRFQQAGLDDPATDARLLIAGLLAVEPVALVTRAGERLTEAEIGRIDAAVARRLAHEPVHRILGERAFYGLSLSLSPDTLEPRPDSEILVDAVIPHLQALVAQGIAPRILDMGTGTGAICLALLAAIPEAIGIGSDISPEALETALQNAAKNGLAARFATVEADWFSGLAGSFHAIVSNPPYIPTGVIAGLAPEVTEFDPIRALDGGSTGLDAYLAIAKDAASFMHAGAVIAVETGYDQHPQVTAIFAAHGFKLLRSVKDYGQNDRVLVFGRALAGAG